MLDDFVCSRVLKGVVAQIKILDLEFEQDGLQKVPQKKLPLKLLVVR